MAPAELKISLDTAHGELLRAFVREACLADELSPARASVMADDAARLWAGLCANVAPGAAVRLIVAVMREHIVTRFILPGHDRFAGVFSALLETIPSGGGLSYREKGVDGWELQLSRPLSFVLEAHHVDEPPAEAPAEEEFTIDVPREVDTPAIARCFLQVYGHSYIHSEVFSPRRYWAKVKSGELIPVVARKANGEVVGHVALEREPGSSVAERGQAVVLPAYRGHHLLEQMTAQLSKEALRHGLTGVYAKPLTVHTFSQRNDERDGMPPCALFLGARPENMRPKGIATPTAGQRQSLLCTFRFLDTPEARKCHAPDYYRERISEIFDALGAKVEHAFPKDPEGPSRTSVSASPLGDGAIHFDKIGANVAVELKQALTDVLGFGARSVQLEARLDDPGLSLLSDAARKLGFFFCGVGPAFGKGADMMIMQYLVEPLDIGKLQLFSDRTKALARFIEEDRAAVTGNA